MSTTQLGRFEDIQVVVRLKIASLWISMLFLFAVSVYIAIASAMIFLTVVLRPAVNRWINIVLAALYLVSIAASMVGEKAYFVFLSILEIALLALIIWYAWTWPKTSPATD